MTTGQVVLLTIGIRRESPQTPRGRELQELAVTAVRPGQFHLRRRPEATHWPGYHTTEIMIFLETWERWSLLLRLLDVIQDRPKHSLEGMRYEIDAAPEGLERKFRKEILGKYREIRYVQSIPRA